MALLHHEHAELFLKLETEQSLAVYESTLSQYRATHSFEDCMLENYFIPLDWINGMNINFKKNFVITFRSLPF